jgi:hypothetical protein
MNNQLFKFQGKNSFKLIKIIFDDISELVCWMLINYIGRMQVKKPSRLGNNLNYRPGMANISPKKNKMLMGVTFSKKTSIRTLNTSNTKDNNVFYYRCSTHSI